MANTNVNVAEIDAALLHGSCGVVCGRIAPTHDQLHQGSSNALYPGDVAQRQKAELFEWFEPQHRGPGAHDDHHHHQHQQQQQRVLLQVEPYGRSVAGGKELEACDMRSPLALEKSMHFLIHHYVRRPHTHFVFTEPFLVWRYLWDRMRGVRTMWIRQLPLSLDDNDDDDDGTHNKNDDAPSHMLDATTGRPILWGVLRRSCQQRMRWLELTIAALSVGGAYLCLSTRGCQRFAQEKKNFLESLAQCFADLVVSYRAEPSYQHAEMVSCLLLLYGLHQPHKLESTPAFCKLADLITHDGATHKVVEDATQSVHVSLIYSELEKQPYLVDCQAVRVAMELIHAWAHGRWGAFFHTCRCAKLTPLQRAVVFQSFTYARFRLVLELLTPNILVYPKQRLRTTMRVNRLAHLLIMSTTHCLEFLRAMGVGHLLKQEMMSSSSSSSTPRREWVLQLCSESSEPLISVEEIDEHCHNRTELCFPTHASFFGFQLWREAYDLFPDAPLAGRNDAPAQRDHDDDDGEGGGGDDDDDDMLNGSELDEEDAYHDEYFHEDGEEVRGDADQPAHNHDDDINDDDDDVREDDALLSQGNCPVNLMRVLEMYCPTYAGDVARYSLSDVPDVWFSTIAEDQRAMLREAHRLRGKRIVDDDAHRANSTSSSIFSDGGDDRFDHSLQQPTHHHLNGDDEWDGQEQQHGLPAAHDHDDEREDDGEDDDDEDELPQVRQARQLREAITSSPSYRATQQLLEHQHRMMILTSSESERRSEIVRNELEARTSFVTHMTATLRALPISTKPSAEVVPPPSATPTSSSATSSSTTTPTTTSPTRFVNAFAAITSTASVRISAVADDDATNTAIVPSSRAVIESPVLPATIHNTNDDDDEQQHRVGASTTSFEDVVPRTRSPPSLKHTAAFSATPPTFHTTLPPAFNVPATATAPTTTTTSALPMSDGHAFGAKRRREEDSNDNSNTLPALTNTTTPTPASTYVAPSARASLVPVAAPVVPATTTTTTTSACASTSVVVPCTSVAVPSRTSSSLVENLSMFRAFGGRGTDGTWQPPSFIADASSDEDGDDDDDDDDDDVVRHVLLPRLVVYADALADLLWSSRTHSPELRDALTQLLLPQVMMRRTSTPSSSCINSPSWIISQQHMQEHMKQLCGGCTWHMTMISVHDADESREMRAARNQPRNNNVFSSLMEASTTMEPWSNGRAEMLRRAASSPTPANIAHQRRRTVSCVEMRMNLNVVMLSAAHNDAPLEHTLLQLLHLQRGSASRNDLDDDDDVRKPARRSLLTEPREVCLGGKTMWMRCVLTLQHTSSSSSSPATCIMCVDGSMPSDELRTRLEKAWRNTNAATSAVLGVIVLVLVDEDAASCVLDDVRKTILTCWGDEATETAATRSDASSPTCTSTPALLPSRRFCLSRAEEAATSRKPLKRPRGTSPSTHAAAATTTTTTSTHKHHHTDASPPCVVVMPVPRVHRTTTVAAAVKHGVEEMWVAYTQRASATLMGIAGMK